MSFSTPILFLIFNRPIHTKRIFETIKAVRPKKLYVAADGPRVGKDGELQLCLSTRNIVKEIDWDCEVKTLYRDENLGCKMAVSSAITWFFENESEGIILEDDCLADPSFFTFCEVMLERYRSDERVMQIGGSNLQLGKLRGTGDYYFSRLTPIWGWATWRRAWALYDIKMTGFETFLKEGILGDAFNNRRIRNHLRGAYTQVKNGADTWDYQWSYTCVLNNGVSIIPQKNLIVNIGFDNQATHSMLTPSKLKNLKLQRMTEYNPPLTFVPNQEADNYVIRVATVPLLKRILHRLKREIRSRL